MLALYRYKGQKVEVIYMDQQDRFTQRTIQIYAVHDDWVLAYCFSRGGMRRFCTERILAVRMLTLCRETKRRVAGSA